MQTDFPTVELYFCFAFTFCRLKVYKEEEQFTRRLIEMSPGVELSKSSDSESWHEVDTPVLMAMVSASISAGLEEKLLRLSELSRVSPEVMRSRIVV